MISPLLQCHQSSHSLHPSCQGTEISFGSRTLLLERQRQFSFLTLLVYKRASEQGHFFFISFNDWSLSDFRSELMCRYLADFPGKPGAKCHISCPQLQELPYRGERWFRERFLGAELQLVFPWAKGSRGRGLSEQNSIITCDGIINGCESLNIWIECKRTWRASRQGFSATLSPRGHRMLP